MPESKHRPKRCGSEISIYCCTWGFRRPGSHLASSRSESMPLAVYAAVVPIIRLLIRRQATLRICHAFDIHSPLHIDLSITVMTRPRSSRRGCRGRRMLRQSFWSQVREKMAVAIAFDDPLFTLIPCFEYWHIVGVFGLGELVAEGCLPRSGGKLDSLRLRVVWVRIALRRVVAIPEPAFEHGTDHGRLTDENCYNIFSAWPDRGCLTLLQD